jgi:CRP/FNR family transcriptional regulator
LGPALLRVLAKKIVEADSRIESLAIDQISQRLIKALLRLGERFGEPTDTSEIHIMPITHELLARYVGTSREIITQHMSQLRRQGLVKYSRAGMEFNPAELSKNLTVS